MASSETQSILKAAIGSTFVAWSLVRMSSRRAHESTSMHSSTRVVGVAGTALPHFPTTNGGRWPTLLRLSNPLAGLVEVPVRGSVLCVRGVELRWSARGRTGPRPSASCNRPPRWSESLPTAGSSALSKGEGRPRGLRTDVLVTRERVLIRPLVRQKLGESQ